MRWVKAVTAGAALLVLLAGVPLLLLRFARELLVGVRDLLAGDVTDHSVLTVLVVIAAAAVVVGWVQFTVAFAVEFTSGIRRTPVPARVRGVFPGQQRLARALVTAVLLLGPTVLAAAGPTITAAAAATPATPAAPIAATVHSVPVTAAAPVPAVNVHTPVATPVEQVTITAGGPRTWWDLAERHLGAGDRWRTLWDLNQDTRQPDGTVLTHPTTLLRTGWVVTVPATSTVISDVAAATGDTALTDTTGTTTAQTADRVIDIVRGDTLSELAAAHGTTWPTLWDLNRDRPEPDGQRFTDPDHIEPGWTITLPAAETPTGAADVTVRPGDTLSEIAAEHHTTTAALWAVNQGHPQPGGDRLTDPDHIEPGWVLHLPNDHTTSTETAAPTTDGAPSSTGADEPADRTVGTPSGTTGQAGDAAGDIAAPTVETPTAGAAAPTTVGPGGPTVRDPVPSSGPEIPAVGSAAGSPAGTAPTPPGTIVPEGTAASAMAPPGTGTSTSAEAPPTPAPSGDEPGVDAPSVVSMLAAGGGAVVLTAVGLMAWQRARRRQFRLRRPSRATTPTPPAAGRMERVLRTAGQRGYADVTWLDRALRSLVHTLADIPDARLADVTAVRLGGGELQLILATPMSTAPAPWRVADGGMRWTVRRGDDLPYDDTARDTHIPPFPLLVSVGYTPGGDHYLLDLERIGSVTLGGDPDRCLNLARYLAAEIAHNQWSELLQVTLVGFGQEMADLNPTQLRYTPNLAGVNAAVRSHLAGVRDVITDTGVDVTTGRLHNIAGDTWAPHLVLIGPDAAARDPAELTALLAQLDRDRLTIAVVVLDDTTGANPAVAGADARAPADRTRWQLTVDADGALTVPVLDVQLVAEQLPADEAGPLTQLLVAAAVEQDQPMPDADGDQPWDGFADAAGNLRTGLTTAAGLRVAGTWPGRANSILPLSPKHYADTAATTEEDVIALAPGLPDDVRQRLAASDPTLDDDLAAWWDPDAVRVKLRLLGPVDVWSPRLDPAPPGKPQKVEAVAYLATRGRGASAAQARADLWPDDRSDKPTSKVRNLMLGTRAWLGVNPATGREHLPPNAGEDRGGLYTVDGILIDAELFRRLRLRAMARGPAGIADLRDALELVTGVPFEGHRPRGYGWNGDLLSHYTAMIADTAHLVATHHLAAAQPEPAAAAAQVALLAGSTADNVLLDLVAACHARGDRAGGDSYVHQIMTNYGTVEEDIPARTYQILLRRGWLPQRSA